MQILSARHLQKYETQIFLNHSGRNSKTQLKVSKFQKQIFLFSFEPKSVRKYFLNSVLASKMGQIKKVKALHYIN